jgi:hypothetical protein
VECGVIERLICGKISLDFRTRSPLRRSAYEAKYTLYGKG